MPGIAKLQHDDVVAALDEIRRDGIPARRASRTFCLVGDGGTHFAPKYVAAIATALKEGRRLASDDFSGGDETNAALRRAGFTIEDCVCGGLVRPAAMKSPRPSVTAASAAAVANRFKNTASPLRTTVCRLVVNGPSPADEAPAEAMLLEALTNAWPADLKATFLQTPGGYAEAPWPTNWSGKTSWASRPSDVETLIAAAEPVALKVLSNRVREVATGKVEVITLGIDLYGDPDDLSAAPHAELVAVFDVESRAIVRWTGKSYPMLYQERTLVQVSDLSSHFIQIAGERVLILGCHDLNLFSNRAYSNSGTGSVRRTRIEAMRDLTGKFRPTVILQHPHTTDTPRIWRPTWMPLVRANPTVKAWASGMSYTNPWGPERATLEKARQGTKGGDVVDIILSV